MTLHDLEYWGHLIEPCNYKLLTQGGLHGEHFRVTYVDGPDVGTDYAALLVICGTTGNPVIVVLP